MGTFVVQVRAVGNHGCQREKKHGEAVEGCGQPGCVDCLAREFVSKLQAVGTNVEDALLIHWPQGSGTVVDNLRTKQRSGQF